jgi:hypothetical protein
MSCTEPEPEPGLAEAAGTGTNVRGGPGKSGLSEAGLVLTCGRARVVAVENTSPVARSASWLARDPIRRPRPRIPIHLPSLGVHPSLPARPKRCRRAPPLPPALFLG